MTSICWICTRAHDGNILNHGPPAKCSWTCQVHPKRHKGPMPARTVSTAVHITVLRLCFFLVNTPLERALQYYLQIAIRSLKSQLEDDRQLSRDKGAGGLDERRWRDKANTHTYHIDRDSSVVIATGKVGGGRLRRAKGGWEGDRKRLCSGRWTQDAVCRCLVEFYTWKLYGFKSQCHSNKFHLKKRTDN